ncbi:MAG: ROK family protein, partial [Caldisericaceae bacterium]|nr:ROK family protein [Caldisericaceae bacterium]
MDLTNQAIIGVDLGGTKIHAARIREARVEASVRQNFSANGNEKQVLTEIIDVINQLNDGSISAIGIGVPGLVDLD